MTTALYPSTLRAKSPSRFLSLPQPPSPLTAKSALSVCAPVFSSIARVLYFALSNLLFRRGHPSLVTAPGGQSDLATLANSAQKRTKWWWWLMGSSHSSGTMNVSLPVRPGAVSVQTPKRPVASISARTEPSTGGRTALPKLHTSLHSILIRIVYMGTSRSTEFGRTVEVLDVTATRTTTKVNSRARSDRHGGGSASW